MKLVTMQFSPEYFMGTPGITAGSDTMLQAGRSRVRLPIRSFQLHYGPGVDSSLTEMSTRNLPGGKGQPAGA
jgi:hypothetical protein